MAFCNLTDWSDAMNTGIVLGLWIVGLAGYFLLAYALAQKKMFFTAPHEGTAEFVVAGGSAVRMIAVWKGHHTLPDHSIVKTDVDNPAPPDNTLRHLNPLNWLEPWGIYWVGLYPFQQIYHYDFVWIEETVGEDGKIVPRTRRATKKGTGAEGQTAYIRINDTNYFFVVDDVKTSGNIPTRFVVLVTVRVENPYKALFGGEDWLERLGGMVSQMVIKYAGVLTYEDIVAGKPAELALHGDPIEHPYSLEELVKTVGDGSPDEGGVDMLTTYGVGVVAAKLHSFDFADSQASQELRNATVKRYTAEQEGLAELAKAQGEASAIGVRAKAEVGRINAVYGAVSDKKEDRMAIRRLEALEKTGPEGRTTVVVPDELLGLARGLIKKD